MSVTFKESYREEATGSFSQENLTTLIKTNRKVINSSNLAYTMSLVQGQILNENGIRISIFVFRFPTTLDNRILLVISVFRLLFS